MPKYAAILNLKGNPADILEIKIHDELCCTSREIHPKSKLEVRQKTKALVDEVYEKLLDAVDLNPNIRNLNLVYLYKDNPEQIGAQLFVDDEDFFIGTIDVYKLCEIDDDNF